MILLSGTSNSLQAVMGGAATTTQPSYFVSYSEVNASTPLLVGANTSGALNGASQVSLLTGNASYQSKVNQIEITNLDTVNQTITVSVLVSSTNFTLYTAILQPGYTLHYLDGPGFSVTNSAGQTTSVVSSTSPNVQIFSTPGNFVWTKPTSFTPSIVSVTLVGAGGGGGGGGSVTTGAIVMGGAGGGGGAYNWKEFNASDLASTVNLTVGTGGTGGTVGASGQVGVVGVSGTASLFGGNTMATAYAISGGGGGGAFGAVTGAIGTGGSGGGTSGNGVAGSTALAAGGLPGTVVAASFATGGQGGASSVSAISSYGEFGGGGGGTHTAVPAHFAGATSLWAGGGGGQGGGATASALVQPTAGGLSGQCVAAGAGGGAAGTSSTTPTQGSNGANGSSIVSGAGGGGGGGGSGTSVSGMVGGNGGFPGGGGGGGGSAWTSTGIGGQGGAGGNGVVIVACW